MTKPLVPADFLKNLQAADKPAAGTSAEKPKATSHPKPMVKASTKPQGKTGVAHTRMSNRGK
ncbi:MAG TPA: hypothetical protein VGK03_06465 [Geothrix sp.]|jgi:hypothetical protein